MHEITAAPSGIATDDFQFKSHRLRSMTIDSPND